MKEITSLDRLALSRAQHLEYREKNEDEEELSDWSESDRECCPVSDGELDDENFLPTTTNTTTATPIFIERKATPIVEYTKKFTKTPLLPARRLLPSRNQQNRTQSINSSALSHEEITRGPTASPNLSQISVSRLYETKKIFYRRYRLRSSNRHFDIEIASTVKSTKMGNDRSSTFSSGLSTSFS